MTPGRRSFLSLSILFLTLCSLVQAQSPPLTPIGALHRNLDSLFIPRHLEDTVTVAGRILVPGRRFTPDRIRTFLFDGTGGIQLFSEDTTLVLQAGDSVWVTGVVGQFNGLEEIRIQHIEKRASGLPLPPPVPLPPDKSRFEELEGQLVYTEGVIVFKEDIARGTYWIIRQGENSIMVWFYSSVARQIPLDNYRIGDQVHITGILGQYDAYPPYSGNYQLFPRGPEDIRLLTVSSLAFYQRFLLFGGIGLILAVLWILTLQVQIRRRTAQLRMSELNHRRLINLLPEAVLVYQNEHIAYANQRAAELFGYQRPADLINMHFKDLVDPRYHAVVRKHLRKAIALSTMHEPIQETLVRSDGTCFTAEVTSTHVHFNGKPSVLTILRDVTERERQQARIQEMEAFYEQIIEHLPLELVVFDRHLRLQYISRSAIKDPEKRKVAPGTSPLTYARLTGQHADIALRRQYLLEQVLHSGQSEQFEEVLPSPEGDRHYLRFLQPILNEKGEVEAIMGYGIDVTPLKHMEKTLREKQEFLETVLQTMGQGLTISDDQAVWIYANPAALRILGYKRPEDILGRAFWEVAVDPEKARHVWEERKRGQAATYEIEIYDAHGNIRPLLVNATPLVDEEGNVTGSIAVFSDLTEQKAYEEKLKLSEARYRILSQLISAYAFGMRFSPDGRLEKLWVTDSVEDVLGYSVEDWFAKDWRKEQYIHEEDKRLLIEQLGLMLRGEMPLYTEREIRMYTRAGDLRWMYLYVTGEWQETDGERWLYLYGGVQDITRQKEIERELIEAREKAEEMTRLKSAFLANMSHEIRTPLTAIIGFAQILNDEVPEHLKEFSQMIEQGGLRLLDTLNAVLDMSRLESGNMQLAPAPLCLNEEVQEVVDLMQPVARKKGLELIAILPEEPVWMTTDQGCIRRILDNLVGNALKFTEEGFVQVQVTPLKDEVLIEVIDTGIGISKEFLPHIFEDFRQESQGYTRTHEGSGLGLSITRRLVQLMGGTISVESVKGEGSIFRVTLPLNVPEQASPSLSHPRN